MHAALDPSTLRPLKRVEYEVLVRQGIFEHERVELLYGMVVRMTPIGTDHCSVVERLNEILVLALHGRARIRPQSSLAAGDDSEPEPDFAVVERVDHAEEHPSNAWLIIEVADSSLAHDRKVKGPLYAAVGVPEYWIVNLVDKTIEVYTNPRGGKYTRKTIHTRGGSITLVRFPDVTLTVDDVLG